MSGHARWGLAVQVAAQSLIRSLDIGQAAYIYRGGVRFVQVKRLTAAPPALPREPVAPGEPLGRPAGSDGMLTRWWPATAMATLTCGTPPGRVGIRPLWRRPGTSRKGACDG